MKHFSGAPLWGILLALLANITPGWKGLTETNTLAYYKPIILAKVIIIKNFFFCLSFWLVNFSC
jgi:hypothetical protein